MQAFEYSKVESIFLPSSIKNVKNWTFYECSSLRTIVCSRSTKFEQYAYPSPLLPSEMPQVKIERYKPQEENIKIENFMNGNLPTRSFNSDKIWQILEKVSNNLVYYAAGFILIAVVAGSLLDLCLNKDSNYETKSTTNISGSKAANTQYQEEDDAPEHNTSNERYNVETSYHPQYFPNGYPSNVIVDPSSDPISQPQERPKTVVRNKCPYCKDGDIIQHEYASTLGTDGPRVYCSRCNQSWNYGTIHAHHQCTHCGGRGYTEYEY